jgi:hypothetical protein
MKTNLFTKTNFTAAFVAAALFFGGCKNDMLDDDLKAVNVQDSKASETAQSIMVEFDEISASINNIGSVTYVFRASDSNVKTFFQANFDIFSKLNAGTFEPIGTAASTNSTWTTGIEKYDCDLWNGNLIVMKEWNVIQGPNTTYYEIRPKAAFLSSREDKGYKWDEKELWTIQGAEIDKGQVKVRNLFIASLSAVQNKKNGTKYSLDLLNRVSELTITVVTDDVNKTEVGKKTLADFTSEGAEPDYTYLKGSVLADKVYESGDNKYGKNQTILKDNETMQQIIESSTFGGKEVTDDNTQALSFLTDITFNLTAGKYIITVTGTVKGNNIDTIDRKFSVSKPAIVSSCN